MEKTILVSNDQMKTFENQGFLQTPDFTIVSDDVMKAAIDGLQTSLSAKEFEIVKANRGHLTLKTITDKNGKQKKVWINPNKGNKVEKDKNDSVENDKNSKNKTEKLNKIELEKNANELICVVGGQISGKGLEYNLEDYISENFYGDEDGDEANDFRKKVKDFVNGKSNEISIHFDGGYVEANSKNKTITAKSSNKKETFPMEESSWEKVWSLIS